MRRNFSLATVGILTLAVAMTARAGIWPALRVEPNQWLRLAALCAPYLWDAAQFFQQSLRVNKPEVEVLRPSEEAKQNLALAHLLFSVHAYSRALPLFRQVAEVCPIPEDDGESKMPWEPQRICTPEYCRIGQEARFHEAECQRLLGFLPEAADAYHQVLLDYRDKTRRSRAIGHLFNIANFWLDDTRAEMRKFQQPSNWRHWSTFLRLLYPDRRKPLLDQEGRALEVLEWARFNDIMGPLADKALFLTACVNYYRQDYEEADYYLTQLMDMFPESPLLPLAAADALLASMRPIDHVPTRFAFDFGPSVAEPKVEFKTTVDTKRLGCAWWGQLLRLCTFNSSSIWDRAQFFAQSRARQEFLAPRLCIVDARAAEAAFQTAAELAQAGKIEEEYEKYQRVGKRYPGTPAAERAGECAEKLRPRAAEEAFQRVEKLRRKGEMGKAYREYGHISHRYPGTPAAERAKEWQEKIAAEMSRKE